MSIRRSITRRYLPDVGKLAPDANSNFIHQTLARALEGVGPLPAASVAADKQLAEQGGDVEAAIHEVIENHVRLSAGQGFVTNVGGLVTMAATIPANIAGLAVLQCRMVAGIAHLRGYDLTDRRVRNAVLLCVLGEETVTGLVQRRKLPGNPMTVATAPTYDPTMDKLVAAELTSALVSRVVGKRAASTVVRRIPLAGGVWGAGADAYATWQIGRYAEKQFALRPRATA